MQMDIWSSADLYCATSQLVCQLFLYTIDNDSIIDVEKKVLYDIAMCIVVLATWGRLVMILLVLESFSVLLVTTVEMVKSGADFLFLSTYIIFAISMICLTLFGNEKGDNVQYSTIIQAFIDQFANTFVGGGGWFGDTDTPTSDTIWL